LKRYNFRKPKREAGCSEQVSLISIYDPQEKKHKHDSQQEQEVPLHQEELTRSRPDYKESPHS
jgi:hypothetical protein